METKTQDTSEARRLQMMEKVAKLMDKAKSATELGNLAEAEAFTLGIQRIMNDYNLTEWEVQKNRPEVTSAFKIENTMAEQISYDDYGKAGRPGGHWQLDLWDMLCPNFMCSRVAWKKAKTIALFGTKQNLETIKYIFSFLDNLLPQLALADWKQQDEIENRYQYMRNWIAGAIEGLGVKLAAEKREREYVNNNEQGLMIFNKEALQKAQDEVFGKKLKFAKKREVKYNSATEKGYEKGRTLNINKGVERGEVKEEVKRLG